MPRRYIALLGLLAAGSMRQGDVVPSVTPRMPDVRVEPDVPVGGTSPLPYTEPHLAVDPDDPDRLLVAAIVGFTRSPNASTWECAVLRSRDGGRSWDERPFHLDRCADPWLAFAGDEVWFASLHDYQRGAHGLAVYHSADRGETWDPDPTIVGRGHDHPTMTRAARGGVYVVSSYLTRRTSHISVFPLGVPGLPTERLLRPSTDVINTLQPVVLNDGSLLVPVSAFSRFVGTRQERIEPPRTGTVTFAPTTRSFDEPVAVTRRCGSRLGFAAAAVSDGAQDDDRVYLACVTDGGGDLLVFASPDGGRSWGEPTPVLGTPAPTDGAPPRRAVGIAVNPAGVVGVVWQDRSADPSRRCQVQRFAASTDGGASFSPPVDLASAPSCPDTPRNREAARQWPAGTDYGSVVATRDGRFRAVWADARSGVFQIRMATVSVE